MTVDDSIKCRFANSVVTDQVGGFQNPGVCLQAFPSFLPHPLPALLLAPLFSRSLTLVHPQAAQTHYMNADVTLACERCCVTNGYLQRLVWDRSVFLKRDKNVMFLNKIDVPYCLVVFFVVYPRLRPF